MPSENETWTILINDQKRLEEFKMYRYYRISWTERLKVLNSVLERRFLYKKV